MSVIRARASLGSRNPGLIDSKAISASPGFTNAASLLFGGTNEYVTGPAMNSLGLTFTNQFSVAIWFKWDPADTPDSFQGVCNASSNWSTLADGWGMYWTNATTLRFFVNSFNFNGSNATVSDVNQWNFAVGVYDGTLGSNNIKLYVNAVLGTPVSFTNNLNGQTSSVEIGRTANTNTPAGDYTQGHLDEFAIWNVPLSAEAITTLYNGGTPIDLLKNVGDYQSADNLALWWRCGDNGDSVSVADGIQDASGRGNHGTAVNMEPSDIDFSDFP